MYDIGKEKETHANNSIVYYETLDMHDIDMCSNYWIVIQSTIAVEVEREPSSQGIYGFSP